MSNTQRSILMKLAAKYDVDPEKFWETLKATAFKQRDGTAPSNEQMMALLIVCDQYTLNPFLKEIYAFPDKHNGIVPVVGVDGWSRMINSHKDFDGIEFRHSENFVTPKQGKPCPAWMEAVIYHKRRRRPVVIREYLDEVYNGESFSTSPWRTHTKRMLRHKTQIQGCRVAFGFTGIYDQDEAERILKGEVVQEEVQPISSASLRDLDFTAVDNVLDSLLIQTSTLNSWQAAHELVENRFNGTELQYAKDRLIEAERESLHQMNAAPGAAASDAGDRPEAQPVPTHQADAFAPESAA